MGSSREQAPQVLIHLGIGGIVAKSFARIFYRNALNLGLPILDCPQLEKVSNGDRLRMDPASGLVENLTTDQRYQCDPIPPELMAILDAGGLMPYLKKRFESQGR